MREVFGSWVEEPARVAESFAAAAPFPHVVIDGFLDVKVARALAAEFPAMDEMPRSRDYVFGKKHELSSVGSRGGAAATYRDALLSADFAEVLSEVCGTEVFVDPDFHGGGFHQGGDGSYLDFHVDFNIHPLHPTWLRTLNVLVYLNESWAASYGGHLQIKSSVDGLVTEIQPLFNRGVVMETSDRTYHGYPKMSLPSGVTRRSIAAYAYRPVGAGSVRRRTTGWSPVDAGPVKRGLAAVYDPLVRAKNAVLGSRTARNR